MGCCIFLISTKGKLHDCPVGGGHVLGGRGTSVLRARQPPECAKRPPRSGVRHFPRDCLYCVSASQIASPLTAATVNPAYVAGSLCVPVSWGLHVAAWIQKKNGM